MDPDLKPVRPKKPLQAALDARQQTETPKAEPFQTPEEVAANDDLQEPAELVEQVNTELPPAVKKSVKSTGSSWNDKLSLHWPPGKKELLLTGLVVVVVVGVATALLTGHSSAPTAPKAKAKTHAAVAPKPKTVPSNLTGLPVDPAVNTNRPVTAVMIENSLDARPQSGLSQAGVVFEAIAEGGVTRFMALFQDNTPDNVGPIRSARPYYVGWAKGFDAGYAHVGGSPDALADIRNWGVRDLDQFANGGSYHRISSRAAPHNVYTGIPTLNQLETAKGYTSSTYTGFVRKPTDTPSKHVTVNHISMHLSGSLYDPSYVYNAKSNSYDRSENGAPQVDANSNQQLSPKVVIAIVVPLGQGALDASGAYYSDYQYLGSGTAYIFQDGISITASWSKASNESQISFTDSTGQPVHLNPGQTWISAVSSAGYVGATP